MEKQWLFTISRILAYLICRFYFRIEYVGADRVPTDRPVIVAPNHVSYLDPVWVSLPIKRPLRYMAWDQMMRLPLLGSLMRAYGAFPVSLEKGDRTALRLSLEQLRRGGGLVLFPEGARTRDGHLKSFKPGVIRLALDTNAPIVPVTIIGGYEAYAPRYWFPRPYKLKVIYHDPIELRPPSEHAEMKRYMQEQSVRLQKIVASALPVEAWPLQGQQVIGA
ncbi:MAG: 1-acyl-sn-glycerol-3-phosphate acyltransferase [Acidobacteria bacterium]|nr:1-acyl-sn-glycerol-3-phosphate acyltransferase [Acidobacteriota bacterium]